MYSMDILVIMYPNRKHVESIIIVDPYDKKVSYHYVKSDDEIKDILLNNLPFCDQNHPPLIHGGDAYVIDWESIPENKIGINSPDDIKKVLS